MLSHSIVIEHQSAWITDESRLVRTWPLSRFVGQISRQSYTEGISFASSANSNPQFSSMRRETSDRHKTESNPEGLIHGNSRMAEVIRTHDWSLTPLGPIEDWSENLLFSANLMLACAFPSLVFWSEELVQLYNDAFIPLLAERHPSGLGQTAQEC
jgi:hypothetical protein